MFFFPGRGLLFTGDALITHDGVTGESGPRIPSRAFTGDGFGTKQSLMKAVYDTALAGDADPVAIGDRQVIADIWATPVGIDKVRRYAAFVTAMMQRLADLLVVLTDTDPEVAQVRETTERERLTGIRAFIDHLAETGHLPPGTEPARAADSCWALTSPVMFQQLVRGRGWPAGAYEAWLARMLAAALSISA